MKWAFLRVCAGMGTSTRALLVAVLAVVGAFIGSTIWVTRVARAIDADALLISRDAAPGIELLSRLRAEIRNLEVEVLRGVDTHETQRVDAARRRIDALLSQVMALPTDPREAKLLGNLTAEMRAFDEAVERAVEQSRVGHLADARRTLGEEVRRRGDAATTMAQELVDYDARVAQEAAVRIEEEHARANRIAIRLDALSALLAAVASWLALRVIRQGLRVQQENQRLAERKAEELEQFAGRVAHDILSPLSAVGLGIGLAQRSAPQASEALARGAASLGRVRRIVDGLLEFARAGAQPEHGAHTDVRPLVAGLAEELAPFAAERQAALRTDPVPAVAVSCSSGVLLSLLSNLLRNAIKYLGEVQVREVSLRVRRRRGRVIFEVEDTGPGISAALADRVFEPYVRGPNTGVPGIGLGLATVKRLAESHGGAVGLRPGARGGALFWFELDEAPASDAPAAQLGSRGEELQA
jgi:signal transduction histidine kinase